MKSITIRLLARGLALMATNAAAQYVQPTPPATPPPAAAQPHHYPAAAMAQRTNGTWDREASSIIGLPVFSSTGERIGKLQDVIVNLASGSAPFAIVEEAETANTAQPRVAVPLTDLKWSRQPRRLVLSATKAQFDAASTAPNGAWASVAGEEWVRGVNRFYGQPTTIRMSRFERQEVPGTIESRESVRAPSERKGATELEPQPAMGNPEVVVNPATPTDQVLARRVGGLINQDVGEQAGLVRASVNSGVVSLAGQVPNETVKKNLVSQIMALPGVSRVEDALTTQP